MYEPVSEVGGDFYLAASIEPTRMRVVIGDACGKGVRANTIVSHLQSSVRTACLTESTPERFLSVLNDAAARALTNGVFVTAACIDFMTRHRIAQVANAGHVPPVVWRRDGSIRILPLASGPPLGILSNIQYRAHLVDLAPGDVVLLMTDGVVEAFGPDVEGMGGIKHLLSALRPTQTTDLIRTVSDRMRATRTDDAALVAVTWPREQ